MEKIISKQKICMDNINNNLSEEKIKKFKKHLQMFYIPKYKETINFLENKNIKNIVIIQPSYHDLR